MKIKQIESASNELYQNLLLLTKSKGVRQQKRCLVSGEKIIRELVEPKASPKVLSSPEYFWIYSSEDHPLLRTQMNLQLLQLSKKLFDELDVLGTHAPLLGAPVPDFKEWKGEEDPTENELLCGLGDPNNLGALLRSARAFGVKRVILLEEACHPFHPKVIKASAGTVFQMEFFSGPSIQNLDGTAKLYALDSRGQDLSRLQNHSAKRLLLGEEGQGIPANLACEKIAIPIAAGVESLNATVAASIALYELSKK